jgi:hypothetical protein
MRTRENVLRWIAVLAALVMLAAACGDDSSGTDSAPPDDTPSDDAGSGDADADSDGTGSDDTDSDDMDSDDMDSDDMDSDAPPPGSTLDCAEIQAAVEAAGDFTALDPSGGSDPANLEASFNQSRAALAALGDAAPEIADDVDQAVNGLDALGAIFAELDWNTDFASNPQAGLQLATALGDTEIMGMIGAMTAISTWIATSCSS